MFWYVGSEYAATTLSNGCGSVNVDILVGYPIDKYVRHCREKGMFIKKPENLTHPTDNPRE